jgi:anti-sigma factor RsiW
MNCTQVRQHGMLYLDSEGGPELHLHINAHLAGCESCAAWLAQQQRLEQVIGARLASGGATRELWGRILARTGIPQPRPLRRRRLVQFGLLAAAPVVLLMLTVALWKGGQTGPQELARDAAAWHEQWLRGNLRLDLKSTSDEEVDRYLKARVPFRVHCPPRTDVNFAVEGAGVCQLKDRQQAAYIVGRVEHDPVSILVLDRRSLAVFPTDRAHLQTGQPQSSREGDYRLIAGIVADNLVVVIGTAPAEALEKLLHAYGTYPDS